MNKPRYELADLKAAAHGRWPEIHAALGVPSEYLNTRKHQPCPYCGGCDRYRYTDHQHSGSFICNQCTPQGGSGFDLLMLVFGYDFKQAAHEVAVLLGMAAPDTRPSENPTPRPPLPLAKAEPIHDKQPALLKTWHEAQPLSGQDPASLYLHARGLPADTGQHTGGAIRHHAALPLYALRASDNHTAAPLLIGYYPAMIAAITDTGGQLQGLHLTYLQQRENARWCKARLLHPDTGEPLPAKKMRARRPEALRGAAVQMGKPDPQGRLLVAEGIETALAARALFNLPAVAALSAIGMSRYQWPPDTQSLFIAADNDPNQTGQQAAESLARRAFKSGIQAAIWQPPDIGQDALDAFNAQQADEQKAV